jgi:phage-related protein
MEDVALTFNPLGFISGINKVISSMLTFEKTSQKTTKKSEDGINKVSSFMVAKGMIMANIIMSVAKRAWSSIKANIPEIGKTFSIAGDIISRNLLWPLRQELIPVLQKILNWVRDHRIMFVRLGQVIANVFRAIVTIVKSVFDLASRAIGRLVDGLKRIFGQTKATIEQILNLIVFKITAIVLFMESALAPIFDTIVDLFLKIAEYAKILWDNFKTGFGEVTPIIEDVMGLFREMKGLIDDLIGTNLNGFFSALGTILGSTVRIALEGVIHTLDTLITGIKELKLTVSFLKGDMSWAEMKKQKGELEKELDKRGERRWESAKSAGKRMVGAVTGNTPSTNIQTNQNNKNVNIDNSKININAPITVGPNVNPHDVSKAVDRGVTDALKKAQQKRGG